MIVVENDLDFDILIDPLFEILQARQKLGEKYESRLEKIIKDTPHLTPSERRKLLKERYPDIPLTSDDLILKPLEFGTIAKPTGRKVVLTYFKRGDPRNARHIKGEIREGVAYLNFYGYWERFGYWTDFEATHIDSKYNKNPIGDRYNGEQKAIIYSTFYLPKHLANYFGVDELYKKLKDNCYGLRDFLETPAVR